MELSVDIKHISVAVGLTRMVQVPCLVPKEGSINDVVLVEPEHITIANA